MAAIILKYQDRIEVHERYEGRRPKALIAAVDGNVLVTYGDDYPRVVPSGGVGEDAYALLDKPCEEIKSGMPLAEALLICYHEGGLRSISIDGQVVFGKSRIEL